MIKQEVCFRENIACEGVIQGQVNRAALPAVSFLNTGFTTLSPVYSFSWLISAFEVYLTVPPL